MEMNFQGFSEFGFLTNLEILLSLPTTLPLLIYVNERIKFAQLASVFVCDYVAAIKVF